MCGVPLGGVSAAAIENWSGFQITLMGIFVAPVAAVASLVCAWWRVVGVRHFRSASLVGLIQQMLACANEFTEFAPINRSLGPGWFEGV